MDRSSDIGGSTLAGLAIVFILSEKKYSKNTTIKKAIKSNIFLELVFLFLRILEF